MNRIADALLNLLYPQDCVICGAPVHRTREHGVCHGCWESVLKLRIRPPFCPSCGLPFDEALAELPHLCGRCSVEAPAFSGARAFGYYAGALRNLLHLLKFRGKLDLVALFLPLMADTLLASWADSELDLLVPIPLHWRRRLERGYNQAALLSRPLARLSGIPHCATALERVRHTAPQVGQSYRQRSANMKNAFCCRRPRRIQGKRILLVDDVMTTGATAASASLALLRGGAARVSVLTLARTDPDVG